MAYIYYSNNEFSDGTFFLDSNVFVSRASVTLVNEVFSQPVDNLITGSVIYQGNQIFGQASADLSAYPAPGSGTSTRKLQIADNFGDIFNSTVNYATGGDVTHTFTVVGGRNYFVRASSAYAYPTQATLTIMEMYAAVSGYYEFQYYLDEAVDGDFTITSNGGISANMYFSGNCTGGSEVTFLNSSSSTVLKGQYGYASVTTGESTSYGFGSYELQNAVYIDGEPQYLQHGDTFVRGATTVTVHIQTSCGGL